jgi:4-alpha-glucanotransferase
LQLAFQNSLKEKGFYTSPDYLEFKKRNRYWIDDYCLFEALSEEQKTKQWSSWPIGLRNRQESAMKQASIRLASAIMYQEFMQYIFDFQWRKLRSYAASKHIALLGDIPIFVSLNSADVWAKQNLFLLDKDKKPTHITGVPPDRFNADGQLWGNAFYRWNTMKADGYSWWIERLKRQLSLFDGIRLDHFIGFYRCWRVAAGAKNARVGEFVPGPRDDFFEVIQEKLGHLPLVAEDLGLVIPEVEKLRDKFELPGMKVLQFAFGGEDQDPSHKPYRIPVKSVVYPGTHDNNTTKGWYKSLAKSKVKDKQCALEFRNVNRYIETSASTVAWDFIRLAMASPASVSILPAQDLLSLPSSARMNIPGTAEGNWKWRLKEKALDSKVAAKLSDFTEVYGRVFKV